MDFINLSRSNFPLSFILQQFDQIMTNFVDKMKNKKEVTKLHRYFDYRIDAFNYSELITNLDEITYDDITDYFDFPFTKDIHSLSIMPLDMAMVVQGTSQIHENVSLYNLLDNI